MLMKDDRFNDDGTVNVYMNCYMKMSRLDYLVHMALHCMNDEEKERLLLEGIPQITNGRVVPDERDTINLKKRSYRLKNFKMFIG